MSIVKHLENDINEIENKIINIKPSKRRVIFMNMLKILKERIKNVDLENPDIHRWLELREIEGLINELKTDIIINKLFSDS